jgi:hypothetical protein
MDLKITTDLVSGALQTVTLPQRAVLHGDNGAGKTSVLNALRIVSDGERQDVGGKDPAKTYKSSWGEVIHYLEDTADITVTMTNGAESPVARTVKLARKGKPQVQGDDLKFWFVMDEVEDAIRGGNESRIKFLARHFLADEDIPGSASVETTLIELDRLQKEVRAAQAEAGQYEKALVTLGGLVDPSAEASAVAALGSTVRWVESRIQEKGAGAVKCPVCASGEVTPEGVQSRKRQLIALEAKVGVGMSSTVVGRIVSAITQAKANHQALKAARDQVLLMLADSLGMITHRINQRVNVWMRASGLEVSFGIDISGYHVALGLSSSEGPIPNASGGQWVVLKLALAAAISSPGRGEGVPVVLAPDRAISQKTLGGMMKMLAKYGGFVFIPSVISKRGRMLAAWEVINVDLFE